MCRLQGWEGAAASAKRERQRCSRHEKAPLVGGTAQLQQPSGLPVRGVTPLRELALDQVRSRELMLWSLGGQSWGTPGTACGKRSGDGAGALAIAGSLD